MCYRACAIEHVVMQKINNKACFTVKCSTLFLLLFLLQGAFVYEDKMIDRPLLLQANNIVNLQEIICSLDS